jgi:hypothetical protein
MFLQPILLAMAHVDDNRRSSPGFQSMQQSKHTTLVGCTIATVSSTVLYINVVLLLANGAFRQNNVLNPLVFMVSMDSILNCVGMLLVSGIPKAAMKVYKRRVTKTRGVLTSVTPMPYPPTPPLECENMA